MSELFSEFKNKEKRPFEPKQLSGNKNVFLGGVLNFVWERQRSQRAAFAIFIPFDQQ